MSGPGPSRIEASHAQVQAAEQARASQEAYLLAREAALAPKPTKPKPPAAKSKPPAKKAPAKKPTAAKPAKAKPVKPKPAKVSPEQVEEALPPGWRLLDPPTARAVRRMIDSHPQTRTPR